MKTKFLRYLVNIVKMSQNVTQIVYKFVPLQDFTDKSDINWKNKLDEIDDFLFDKYGFTEQEKKIIRSTIKGVEE